MKIIKYDADWCGPCRTAKQLLINSGVEFTEVDVDENPNALVERGINEIPFFEVLDSNNNVVKTISGSISKEELQEIIEQYG